MSRPANIAKPRIKPSHVFRGLFLCWNNRCHANGETVESSYTNWARKRRLYE